MTATTSNPVAEYLARVRRDLVPWFELERPEQLDIVQEAADVWSMVCDHVLVMSPSANSRVANNVFGRARNMLRKVQPIFGVNALAYGAVRAIYEKAVSLAGNATCGTQGESQTEREDKANG